jgi:hypothetical protein
MYEYFYEDELDGTMKLAEICTRSLCHADNRKERIDVHEDGLPARAACIREGGAVAPFIPIARGRWSGRGGAWDAAGICAERAPGHLA